jgi:hypothetical protein
VWQVCRGTVEYTDEEGRDKVQFKLMC